MSSSCPTELEACKNSRKIHMLTDTELDLILSKWKKSTVDYDTIAIMETMDPCTFSQVSCFMPSIVTSAVYTTTVESAIDDSAEFFYGRHGNPTRSHLESVLTKFEGCNYAVTFSSGQAAIAAIFQVLSKGDHVLCVQSLTGDTEWIISTLLPKRGIECDMVFSRDTHEIVSHIKENTKVLLLEVPSNPLLEMADIRAICIEAKQRNPGVIIVVDNSIVTTIFQRPLDLGADVVVYSLTKYHGGFADVLMGAVLCNSKDLYKSYRQCQTYIGGIPSPGDCYMMIRSLKTFPLRMNRHFRSAMKVAHYLEKHPDVERVFYPGLESHPQHELVLEQMTGFSGLIAFYIKGLLKESIKFCKALKYFRHAGSYGSDVSCVLLPSLTTQFNQNSENKKCIGIEERLIRISVGLGNVETLIFDLDQALHKVFE